MDHSTMRGGARFGFVLLVAGIAVGAVVGWQSQTPLYRSEGLVYVAPSTPSPQDPTAVTVLPKFEGFLALQVQILESRRAAALALESDDWKATAESDDVTAFEARRRVIHVRGTQHIRVRFEDPDAQVARAGARALVEAYQKLASQMNDADERLEFARAQIESLVSRINDVNEKVLTFSAEYGGVEGLEIRHQALVEQVVLGDQELAKVEAKIRRYETDSSEGDLTPREIALESPQMDKHLLELALLEARSELIRRELGEKHAEVVKLDLEIEARRDRIQEFAQDWNRRRRQSEAGGTLAELIVRKTALATRLARSKEKSRKLGQTRIQVGRLQSDRDDLTAQLKRMEALEEQLTEQLVGKGRISVFESGSLPTEPAVDRRSAFAVSGGVAGGMVAFLLTFVLAFFGRGPKASATGGTDPQA